jgi:RNA polymerase sigma-70 factor (ECF subfamily)
VSADSSRAIDLALLRRVVARDPIAVAELYDRYSSLLFGIIMRIIGSRPDAEEVLQEVFVRVWTRADMYDERLGAPAAWLIRIGRNRAIDRLRERRTRATTIVDADAVAIDVDAAAAVAGEPTPEALAQMAEQGGNVRHALAALPSDQRALIEAAFFEGYTHSELAGRFGLPLGTVKTRIRAGMMAMRERLEHAR